MQLHEASVVPNGHFGAPRPGIGNGRHDGVDVRLPFNAKVYAPEECIKLLVNRPHKAYRAVNGRYVEYDDPTIVYEGKLYIHAITHLLRNIVLPSSFPAGYTISYQNGSFPVHWAVYKKHAWRNITHGQQYAINPLSIEWDSKPMALDPYMPRGDAIGMARMILENINTSESEKRRFLEQDLDLDHFIKAGKEKVEKAWRDVVAQKDAEIARLKKGIDRTQVNKTIQAAENTVIEAKKL